MSNVQPEHEHEILTLRSEQRRIRDLVESVDRRIENLATTFAKTPSITPKNEPEEPVHFAPIVRPTSPRSQAVRHRQQHFTPTPPQTQQSQEPPAPKTFRAPLPAVPPCPAKAEFRQRTEEPPPSNRVPKSDFSPHLGADSLELTFGRLWLVRIGIVILLTGLVFLGNLAYQHIVPLLGPGAKLATIYGAGAALAAIGLRIEKTRESLRNYARVLLAGGCGTVYYATYAGHFVEPLRVIASPIVGGALLLGLAGAFAWLADRRRSQTIATVAILLSYYSSGLNQIGLFTLFSCVLLTGTAIFFLIRHRWIRLTLASLVCTYASYAWCRYSGSAQAGTLSVQLAFLSGYWILFAGGGMFADRLAMPAAVRSSFVTFNNAAFMAFGSIELLLRNTGQFWLFAAVFGAVLIGLGFVARWKHPEDRFLDSSLFVQGLALTTLGLCTKLTGYQLSLALAAQSVVLLLLPGERHRSLRGIAGTLSIAGAAWLAWSGLMHSSSDYALTAGLVAGTLVFDAWILKHRFLEGEADTLETLPCVLVGTALFLGMSVAWREVGLPQTVSWFAGGAVFFAAVSYLWRFKELTVLSQALLPIGAAIWILIPAPPAPVTVTEPTVLLAAGFTLALWWQRQRRIKLPQELLAICEAAAATTAGVVAIAWMLRTVSPGNPQVIAVSVAGIAWMMVSLALRARFLCFAGLGFALLNLGLFVSHAHIVHASVALLPIVHMAAIRLLARYVERLGKVAVLLRESIQFASTAAPCVMGLVWAFIHIPLT